MNRNHLDFCLSPSKELGIRLCVFFWPCLCFLPLNSKGRAGIVSVEDEKSWSLCADERRTITLQYQTKSIYGSLI